MPRSLVLDTRPVGFSRTRPTQSVQGKLKFRGGIELRSSDADFGGLSALLVSSDGQRFTAVTDQSHWVSGGLSYSEGNLAGVAAGWIAPMLDTGGRPMADTAGDAEGLASRSDNDISNDLFVSFEGEHRLWRYPFGREGAMARPQALPLPRDVLSAPHNGGLEGITKIGDGLMIAVAERYRNREGNYRAWLLPFEPLDRSGAAGEARPSRGISIRPLKPFSMTDLRLLPGGDLLTLERRYDPVRGVGILLRRISAATLRATQQAPDVPLDGEIIVSLDSAYEIDNMEGLSVRLGERGETLVYIVSDDNFNRPVQRTLLQMFELLP